MLTVERVHKGIGRNSPATTTRNILIFTQRRTTENSSMKIMQRWSLAALLLLLSASFSNGQKGNDVPTIENDVVRISLSASDASLTVVDKRIPLEWRQQVRPGFRVAPDSIHTTPASLSATVLGEGATQASAPELLAAPPESSHRTATPSRR